MSELKLIPEVRSIQLSILETAPPRLSIVASGIVPTEGWTEPQLIPYVYIQPPADGITDFSFLAKEPSGPVAQVITSITAEYLLNPLPENLKGVRIHAAQNNKVMLLNSTDDGTSLCLKGELTDEGVECQAFRTVSGELFTLIGDLKGFKVGDQVVVCGTVADFSFCMQGTTLILSWIGKAPPKC